MRERSMQYAGLCAWLGVAVALGLGGPAAHAASGASPAELQAKCDLGVTLALSGNYAKAESVFVSLLSQSPRDPRALANLGNVYLIRGEPDVALAFYGRAAAMDTSDAGIVLNQAVALMLLNDQEGADARARAGIEKAGGVNEAASLLGLRAAEQEADSRAADKGGDKPHIAKSEITSLLAAAKRSVPVDSSGAAASDQAQPAGKQSARSFRSAGTRASQESVVADMIYWKH
jgi:Tfp pilus assembly protein PilF